MNIYIMDALNGFKNTLSSNKELSFETIDKIAGEFEMMKMEIEQHITNMPQDENHKNIRCSAQNAVQKLSEILYLFEELPYDSTLSGEILELIDDISY